MAHFVYILRNNLGGHYTGHTEDLNIRLKEHNEGSVIATKQGRPWTMEWFCGFRSKTRAIQFEKYLKSGSGRAFRDAHLLSEDPKSSD